MITIESVQKKLKEKGLKLTNQRKAIIEVLVENKDNFLTAEEIFLKSREKCPQTNFSTIYRNLEILTNLNIIHKTNIENNTSMFELVQNDSHHHHIICKKCGRTEFIDFCPLDKILSEVDKKNFTLTDHKFELYGYCDKCKKKDNR